MLTKIAGSHDLDAYQSAVANAVWFQPPGRSILRISGVDWIDFLQRQSTNDLRLVSPRRSIRTVLTNPSARILDFLDVIYETVESALILPLPDRGEATLAYLKSRIFFMDKVALSQVSHELDYADLLGPMASAILLDTGLGIELTEGSTTVDDQKVIVARNGVGGIGYRIIALSDTLALLQSKLELLELSDECYQVLRVAQGLPGPETELTAEYTPLEVGLRAIVSDTKGCYTGQEVMARQITYGKVTRTLRLLNLTEPASQNDDVLFGGKKVGHLTSVVETPHNEIVALAIIKTAFLEDGVMSVSVQSNGRILQAELLANK